MIFTSNLHRRIHEFNKFYRLPCPGTPTVMGVVQPSDGGPTSCEQIIKRLEGFIKTLSDEVQEGQDIIQMVNTTPFPDPNEEREVEIELLTALSDWFGDLIVYCYSEATKYGLPLDKVLDIIMDSNMSKVDANGKCQYDENGKVTKNYEGCQYWKPEPKIAALLEEEIPKCSNQCGEESAEQGV